MRDFSGHPLHILFLPSFYSDPEKPVLGSFFQDQARAVAAVGHTIRVAYVEPRRLRAFSLARLRENHFQTAESMEDGLCVMRLRGWNPIAQTLPGGIAWAMATGYLVRQYIRRHGRPDVIHAHNAIWAGYAASLIRRQTGIPYVLTEHSGGILTGEIPHISRPLMRKAYRDASEVIVVSRALGRGVMPLLSDRTFRVIPNCTDPEFFSPTRPKSTTPSEFVYLVVAHLSRGKGIDVLLRAFAARFREDPRTVLRIGGGGDILSNNSIGGELSELCERLGISHQVTFLGALSREGTRAAMEEADVFVLPSRSETFGVVLLEALSMGLPVVSTRCGGPEDIVTEEAGILVAPDDAAQLSEALVSIRDRSRFNGTAGRARVLEVYSRGALADNLSKVYGSAASSSCLPNVIGDAD